MEKCYYEVNIICVFVDNHCYFLELKNVIFNFQSEFVRSLECPRSGLKIHKASDLSERPTNEPRSVSKL